ncbi:MAG: phytanoyl-CoA dioxygenase family protein [Planctomycetota bacterium]|nr:phytanoyl-CoA dioxygenase family protein [Planctomycetota bacterium]
MLTLFPDLDLDFTFHPVSNPAPRRFTPAQIEEYNREGYIPRVPLFSGHRLTRMQAFFRGNKERIVHHGSGFECFHHSVPELYDIATDKAIVERVNDLIGPDVVCHISQFICKEPGGGGPDVAWHQDSSFNPGHARCVVVWLAVEDADIANGCMWFQPRSHLRGQLDFDEKHRVAGAEEMGEKVAIETPAGHAVFFSDLLLHNSPMNRSERPRPGFTMTYVPADVQIHKNKDRWAVLCSGVDRKGLWPRHGRPGAG